MNWAFRDHLFLVAGTLLTLIAIVVTNESYTLGEFAGHSVCFLLYYYFQHKYLEKEKDLVQSFDDQGSKPGESAPVAQSDSAPVVLVDLGETIQELCRIGAWELDLKDQSVKWTRMVYDIHEIPYDTPVQLIDGLSFYQGEDRGKIEALVNQCIQDGSPYDDLFAFKTAKGRDLIVRAIGEAVYDQHGVITSLRGTFQDVTEQQNQLKHAQSLRDQFVALLENIPLQLSVYGKNGKRRYANQEALEAAQFFPQLYQHDMENIHYGKFLTKSLELNNKSFFFEHFYFPIPGQDEYGYGVRDVSMEKQFKLEQDAIMHSINDIALIVYTDKKGFVTHVNNNFVKVSGEGSNSFLGNQYNFYDHEFHGRKFLDSTLKNIENGKNWKGEIKYRNKSGKIFWTYSSISLKRGPNGDPLGLVIIGFDITKDKLNLEALEKEKIKLIQTSKMATLGEMASGVAHEINNPLAIISGTSKMLKRKIPEHTVHLDKIDHSVKRIAKIVKGLKKFSRESNEIQYKPIQLGALVNEALQIASPKISERGISIRLNLHDSELTIDCDSIQIEQVLINLIVNASDAIYLNSQLEWIEIKTSLDKSNKSVLFQIIDSGSGIHPEFVDKLFNPFFTTKQVDEGTGLGLSISSGIIKDHKGELSYKLIDGHTCFEIKLPIKSEAKPHHDGEDRNLENDQTKKAS